MQTFSARSIAEQEEDSRLHELFQDSVDYQVAFNDWLDDLLWEERDRS